MLLEIIPSILGLLALQSPPQATPPAAPKIDVESFVPADALVVARMRSIDDLNRLVRAFSDAYEPEKPFDLVDVLKEDAPFEANWDSIDRTKPFLVCLPLPDSPEAMRPIFAFHAKDASAFSTAEELQKIGLKMHVEGDVVALALGEEPVLAPQRSAFLDNIDREDIVLRADVAAARKKFGEEVDSALDMLESSSSTGSGVPGTQQAMSSMLARWREIFRSLARWEFRAGQHGDETKIAFEAAMLEGTPLTNMGKTDKVDMAELARGIDAGAPFVYMANMDFSTMQKEWRESLDGVLSTMHEGFAPQMKLFVDAMSQTNADVGPACCVSIGFDARGARIAACLKPKDPAAWVNGCVAALAKLPSMLKTTTPTHTAVDGADVTEIHLSCDIEALQQATAQAPVPGEPGAEAKKSTPPPVPPLPQIDAKVRAFLEKGLTFALAPKNGTVVLAIGDDDHMKSRLARIGGSRSTNTLQRAVHAIAGMNPCFAMQVDLAQLMSNVRTAAEMLGQKDIMDAIMVDAWKKVPPILVSGGLEDRTWRMEIVGDARRTIAAIKASSPETRVAVTAKVHADITMIESALNEYAINNGGKFPDALEVLWTPDKNGQTYLKTTKEPLDPWGRPYLYEQPRPGQPKPRIYTLGRDGKPGGEGDDADIDNLALDKR